MIFISIVIPTYNSEATIDICLSSILKQTVKQYEIICIDGQSDDLTIPKIKVYSSNYSSVNYISEKDNGIYDAMNKGIHKAKGEWILFLGSDDRLANENVLNDLLPALQGNAELVYGNVLIEGKTSWAKENAVYDGPFDVQKIATKNICHQAIFYKKELFEQFGTFDTKYKIWADWEFNLRVFNRIKPVYTDKIIAVFKGEGASTTISDTQFLKDYYYIVFSYLNLSIFSSFFSQKELLLLLAKRFWKERKINAWVLAMAAYFRRKIR